MAALTGWIQQVLAERIAHGITEPAHLRLYTRPQMVTDVARLFGVPPELVEDAPRQAAEDYQAAADRDGAQDPGPEPGRGSFRWMPGDPVL